MRLKTGIMFLAVLWSIAVMSLFVSFLLWARDPRSTLGMTLLDITSWLVIVLTVILVPIPLVVILMRSHTR